MPGMDRVARADIELMKWTDGKHVIWVNADGVGGDGSEANAHARQGPRYFGLRRALPSDPRLRAVPRRRRPCRRCGTPIVAAADGRCSRGLGRRLRPAVEIVHSGGIETRYGHMSRIAAYSGEVVHRGEVIGYVGSTGLSTGPHVHFEVMKNGRPVNPLSVKAIASGPGVLEGQKLVQFQNQLRQLLLVGHG